MEGDAFGSIPPYGLAAPRRLRRRGGGILAKKNRWAGVRECEANRRRSRATGAKTAPKKFPKALGCVFLATGRRGFGHGRGRCRKSRPDRGRPAPARLGLTACHRTFLTVVI